MSSDMHLQFCLSGADISESFYAERDADEVRAWTPDATLLAAVEKYADPRAGWFPSGSDVFSRWTDLDPHFPSWQTAMEAMGVDVDH